MRMEFCVSTSHYKKLLKGRQLGLCKRDFGQKWGCKKYTGDFANYAEVIKFYELNEIWKQIEDILKKNSYSHWRSVQGAPKVIISTILDLAAIFKQDAGSWKQEVIETVVEKLAIILGALGKSYHPELGPYVSEGFIDYFKNLESKYSL
ncbi:hypothetical protein O3G_MSEX013800, partial [Manduca sexta]